LRGLYSKCAFLATMFVLMLGTGTAVAERTLIATTSTETSSTYRLPSGALQTEIFGSPVNFQDEDGDWKPIEEGLEEVAGGGLSNGANSFDLHLPVQMGEGAVRLSANGNWVSYRLLGEETEAAEVEGATASYESGDGDLSFELHSVAAGVKEDIVLADASQPSRYRFELKTSAGLTPYLLEDGSIEVRDSEGARFATLPAPTVADNSGETISSDDIVRYELEELAGGNWQLVVAVDESWLQDSARQFPVVIDPTTVYNAATNQDCVLGKTPPPNGWHACGGLFGGGTSELLAAYSQKEDQPVRTFLRFGFGLNPIPAYAYVSKAVLSLYSPAEAENTPGLETKRVTKAWTTNLNWSYYDGYLSKWTTPGGDFTSEGLAQVMTSQRGSQAGWWNFESESLRELVASWIAKSTPNHGLVVKQIDETKAECEANPANCNRRWVSFRSSATSPAETRPKLTINYYPAAPKTSKLLFPAEGTQTARRLKLKAGWEYGVQGVGFQFREGTLGPFKMIPPGLLRDADGNSPPEWIATDGAVESPTLYFDAANATSTLAKEGGKVQVRAIFEGPKGIAGVSAPVEATVNRAVGGPKDTTAEVGPGSVNLLTGNFTVTRTDVSITAFKAALEFSRTHNSREGEKPGVLGPGWQPGSPVEEANGSDWRSIRIVEEKEEFEGETYEYAYALLTANEGYEIAFEKNGETWVTPPELTGWTLTKNGSGQFVLSEPGGTRTTFSGPTGNNEYLPSSVSQAGGGQTQMVWDIVEGNKRQLKEVIAPSPPGLSCNSENAATTIGCKSLRLQYQTAAELGLPGSAGLRLTSIRFHGAAPGGFGGMTMTSWEVARYAYDSQGRLIEVWDPRISPALKETYTYGSGGTLQTITPPGQEPWTTEYATPAEGELSGKLSAVKRPTLLESPSVAQTTIVYDVPVSGSGAPYDMSGSAVAKWAQEDIPVDAAAVFPPDQVPSSPPSSYSRATVYYMDAEGFNVNVATPAGAGTQAASITTTETDEFGNVVRELGAQNRLRALAAEDSAAKAKQLDTHRHYSADGTEMQEEWGPLHEVRLKSGETVEARFHGTVQYELPEGVLKPPLDPHLPTREVTGADIPGVAADADERQTEMKYDWQLLKPTQTIVDPGGLNIVSTTAYEAFTGLPIEQRQPSNPGGGGAGTTKTVYYQSGIIGGGECVNTAYAGLPCKTLPASQPASGPNLPVTRFVSYSPLGQPTEIVEETPGAGEGGIRKTVLTYDTMGRPTSKRIIGGGAPIPKVETLYDSSSGLPTTQRFACEGECDNQATTTTYDALGRAVAYEDADGNKSTVTYDALGRPATVYDGKGTQTMEYNAVTGLLVGLHDSEAGSFTASYDADGNLVKRVLPNTLVAETTFDPAGAPVALSYTKAVSCGASCNWLDFAVERSIDGQILTESGTLGTQRYDYDKAGRLITAEETPQGGSCTTRAYSYDVNSNRLSKTTRAPGLGGVCASSGGSTQSYEYDAADRLRSTGLTYDEFGRITSLPAEYAGGNALSTTYFSNDMVATQSQAGVTNSFELDAMLRHRQRLQAGGLEGTEIFHYAGASDSPAWTERGSTWSRNIAGIGGELAAIKDSGKIALLQLTNLHGDVSATASVSVFSKSLQGTFTYDEFGSQTSGSTGTRFGWLGGKQRRTELPSGVIQMGVRSYFPTLGRFTSVDPVRGGSANSYEYAKQDPVNRFDLSGCKTSGPPLSPNETFLTSCIKGCIREHCHAHSATMKYTTFQHCLATAKGLLSAVKCARHFCDLGNLAVCGLKCLGRTGPPPPPGLTPGEFAKQLARRLWETARDEPFLFPLL